MDDQDKAAFEAWWNDGTIRDELLSEGIHDLQMRVLKSAFEAGAAYGMKQAIEALRGPVETIEKVLGR